MPECPVNPLTVLNMFGVMSRVGMRLVDGQYCTKQHLITVPDNDDETGGMKRLAAHFGAYLTRSLCAKSLLPKPGLDLLFVF